MSGPMEQRPESPREPKLTFEQALAQLRETVQTLEEGDIPLADATRLLANGVRLAQTCNELLAQAELQVSEIRRDFAPPGSAPTDSPPAGPDDYPYGAPR